MPDIPLVPQFILDSLIQSGRGSSANILITQPRRISAISVATRVHAERMNDGSVGYVIRGESRQTNKTKLLFCTTGVLLRRLSSGDDLSSVTHVIVDEVSECIEITLFLMNFARFMSAPLEVTSCCWS